MYQWHKNITNHIANNQHNPSNSVQLFEISILRNTELLCSWI